MRVAINGWFWDSHTAGSGQYTCHLVQHLRAAEGELEAQVVRPGRNRSNLTKVWFEQLAFPRACGRMGASVAHVPYWAPPLSSAIPVVVTIHDLIPLVLPEYRGGPLVKLYTRLVSAASSRAAVILADSLSSRRDVVNRLGIPEHRVRTIYLAPAAAYSPAESAADVATRQQYGVPDRYLLYLGGFDLRKNVRGLLKAYAGARADLAGSCTLVVAGSLPSRDTPLEPDPRRLAAELGLEQTAIHFTGFVEEEDKPALYRGALALVFPSRYEGFGLPPLEAMACGTPVVCSDAASLPEIVGQGGLLVGPADLAGLREALVRLVNDAALRRELSVRATAQARRFSWDATARQTIEAYQEAALGQGRSPPGA
jgi:glycosyltransferase involved in cell wall biosynthesis